VSPWTPVRDVDLDAVVERAHRLLDLNKDHVWQATTGSTVRGRQHWVFERSGRACLRCGTRVASAEQGAPPYQRLSYWCPRCQPGPAPGHTNARPHPR
jgi:endonuclease-8